jgi:murein DD-endopeptidase MepM/ murein hydrolase activator NlpD
MRLQLYWPVKPFHINQHFGDNMPCVENFGAANQTIISGADNQTCPVGFDKLYQHFGMTGHNGTDLMAGVQNVYAACDGTVIEQQTVPARGLGLGILTDEPVDLDEHGTHYAKVRYWHLKSFAVNVGDHVKTGQLIGVSNNTGYSSGNHLHFEVQPMDKDAGGHPYVALPNHGTDVIAGAISSEPFMVGQYAEDQLPLLASDEIAILAAKRQAMGDGSYVTLSALARFLKTFGY